MASPVEFQIQRSWVLLSKGVGVICLALALGFLATPFVDPDFAWWLAAPGAVVLLAASLGSLRIGFQSARYAIELSEDGIRLPLQGRWAPWSQLSRLVERPVRQRVDILDLGGSCFASLEYQLAHFAEALERTLAGIPQSLPPQDTFRRRFTSGAVLLTLVVLAALFALGAALWLYRGEQSGLLLDAVLVGVLGVRALTEIGSVRLLPEGLAVRRGLRNERIPWAEIASVEFGLRQIGHGNQILDVFVTRPGGARKRIRPPGADPFLLKARIAERLARERTDRG